jgi:cysteinyl-tRNA synthetase
MPLHFHNTLTRTREPFVPADPERVTMYVCGPTVYNFAHIGNARPPVVFDVLARLLRRTYPLKFAANVTDVDDKINAAAEQEGVEIGVITARNLAAYLDDMKVLGVVPPDVRPRVTETMPQIVAMIEKLVATGHAYAADGHVLFSVSSFADYGRLSGRDTEELLAGARVEVAPYKKDPGDFVLWKPSDARIVGWPSPWGRGRPGWHIECSAMVEHHLGETIDIHGGGVDLVFPHHENEVAQSRCAHAGKQYARYWLHNGLVQVNGEKMSKSLGNFLLVRDALAQNGGETVRLALLKTHYRQPLDWTDALVAETRQNLDRLYRTLRDAGVHGPMSEAPAAAVPPAVLAALEDDLNTPLALSELLAAARAANAAADPGERRKLADGVRAGGWLLGVLAADPAKWLGEQVSDDDQALVERYKELRKARNFGEADKIRDAFKARSLRLEVSPDGSVRVVAETAGASPSRPLAPGPAAGKGSG